MKIVIELPKDYPMQERCNEGIDYQDSYMIPLPKRAIEQSVVYSHPTFERG
jgi:hypothetical protein